MSKKKTPETPLKGSALWKTVDFHRPTSHICTETGYSPSYVSTMRRKHAPRTVRLYLSEGSGRPLKADWANLDWRKTDAAIAADTKTKIGTVKRNRKIYA